jgi:hypothetical protein
MSLILNYSSPAGIIANIVEITEKEGHRTEFANTGARQTYNIKIQK